jgi:RHS repeat-associated protein
LERVGTTDAEELVVWTHPDLPAPETFSEHETGAAGSIASHPCKKRKSGAPPVEKILTMTKGGPPANSSAALANTYTYDSFGKLTASTGTVTNPFQYTGREPDSETGVYYYRARYYDPNVGRFLSEDPARFGTGTIDFYSYVENSPLDFNDPTGNAPCCQKNIDDGRRELGRALNNSQIMGQGVFKKYKNCLLRFPDMNTQCDQNDTGCGHHPALSFGTLVISPLGSLGRKGKCGPVASTLLHELVHECYGGDLNGPLLTPLDQEREAYEAECQMFGYGCACARNPKQCGY